MKKQIKIGAISLCLVTLLACSSKEQPKTIVKSQLIYPTCPVMPLCEKPRWPIISNGDLAKRVLLGDQAIEVCQVIIRSYEQCLTPPKENNNNERPH